MKDKISIGFICTHNSCRSQMAEAIAKLKYGEIFNVYSAGSDISRAINHDAVRIIEDNYNIDMLESQKPKLIEDLPNIDVVITMGCDVVCSLVDNQSTEDWDLDDPTGLSDSQFIKVINEIETKLTILVENLKAR